MKTTLPKSWKVTITPKIKEIATDYVRSIGFKSGIIPNDTYLTFGNDPIEISEKEFAYLVYKPWFNNTCPKKVYNPFMDKIYTALGYFPEIATPYLLHCEDKGFFALRIKELTLERCTLEKEIDFLTQQLLEKQNKLKSL